MEKKDGNIRLLLIVIITIKMAGGEIDEHRRNDKMV